MRNRHEYPLDGPCVRFECTTCLFFGTMWPFTYLYVPHTIISVGTMWPYFRTMWPFWPYHVSIPHNITGGYSCLMRKEFFWIWTLNLFDSNDLLSVITHNGLKLRSKDKYIVLKLENIWWALVWCVIKSQWTRVGLNYKIFVEQEHFRHKKLSSVMC